MKRSYLEHIKIVSFGAFSNKAVGPFAPHLNVVYGPNEAGKTTLASFVGGVLFGWEEARGSRNTYKPANAERSGSLFFAQRDASSGVSSAPSDAPTLAAPDGRVAAVEAAAFDPDGAAGALDAAGEVDAAAAEESERRGGRGGRNDRGESNDTACGQIAAFQRASLRHQNVLLLYLV